MAAAAGPKGRQAATPIRKHSVTIAGHATSVSLEAEFWDALTEIARERGVSVNALIESVDSGAAGNLSSALRVFVLNAVRGRL